MSCISCSIVSGIFVYSLQTVQEKCNQLYKKMCQDSRVDVLIPKPIRGLGKLLIRGDGKVRKLKDLSKKILHIKIKLLYLQGLIPKNHIHILKMANKTMNGAYWHGHMIIGGLPSPCSLTGFLRYLKNVSQRWPVSWMAPTYSCGQEMVSIYLIIIKITIFQICLWL